MLCGMYSGKHRVKYVWLVTLVFLSPDSESDEHRLLNIEVILKFVGVHWTVFSKCS